MFERTLGSEYRLKNNEFRCSHRALLTWKTRTPSVADTVTVTIRRRNSKSDVSTWNGVIIIIFPPRFSEQKKNIIIDVRFRYVSRLQTRRFHSTPSQPQFFPSTFDSSTTVYPFSLDISFSRHSSSSATLTSSTQVGQQNFVLCRGKRASLKDGSKPQSMSPLIPNPISVVVSGW